MRKIREALRLRADGFSGRHVAQGLSLGRATVAGYFRRADVEGLNWPLPADLSDANLEQRLFPQSPGEVRRGVLQPDWAYVHAELRRKGVTLSLPWEEYRGVQPPLGTLLRNALPGTGWLWIQQVLQTLHAMGRQTVADDASTIAPNSRNPTPFKNAQYLYTPPGPGMPSVNNITLTGIVGVPYRRCTTPNDRIVLWAIAHLRWRPS